MGENLKVAWEEFSALIWAGFDVSEIAWHIQVCLYQQFKTQTSLCHQERKVTGDNLKVVWPNFF
jgi:hypothetical protein